MAFPTKTTAAQRLAIVRKMRLHRETAPKVIAARYGISKMTVHRIFLDSIRRPPAP